MHDNYIKFGASKTELTSTYRIYSWGSFRHFKWGGEKVIKVLNLK